MAGHLAAHHPGLIEAATGVCSALREFGDRLDRYDEIDHEQHGVFVARGECLETHLRAALMLSDAGLSASAFAVVRTAMEHLLMDRLLQEGSRYQATSADPIPDDTWGELQEEYEAQESRRSRSWAAAPTRTANGRGVFTFRGIADREDDPAATADLLHPIYFELDQYSPTIGRPDQQRHFDDGLSKLEHRVRSAERNRDRWKQWTSWNALRRNIELNGFFSARDLIALDVHYGFLSGFVHATQEGYKTAFGPPRAILRDGSPDVAEELVHLYVATFGAAELRLLCRMEERPPPVRIEGRAEVDALSSWAEAEAAHLWFAGGQPQQYDLVTEWNRRTWRKHRDEGLTGWPEPVEEPQPDDLRYDGDSPAERLRKMHQDFREISTGLEYRSPWPTFGRW